MPGIDASGKDTIRARQRDPGDFEKGSFRTITLDKDNGVKAVIGRLKGKSGTTTQSVLFPKDKFTVAQARKWLKDHDMKTEQTKQAGKAARVSELDDSSFLYVVPSGDGKSRHFPYKDEAGKVSKERLLQSLARIPHSNFSAEVKKQITGRARRIAQENSINLAESFLDDYELVGPLFPPYLDVTLSEFNDGALNGFVAEDMDFYGRKLARVMNSWTNTGARVSEYDQDGRPIYYSSSSENESEDEYAYHDGLVVRSKTTNDSNYNTVTEYSIGDSDSIEEAFDLSEAQSCGGVLKSMRMKKKMSRETMAARIGLTAARLREIEDGDDYDDDELGEIAKGLGVSKQKLSRVLEAFASKDESNGNGVIKIVSNKIRIVSPPFTVEKMEEFKAERFSTIPKSVVSECGYTMCHELAGQFMAESIQEEKDGSLKFSVPLFKENELTYNNNRYTTECSENLVRHLGRLNKKNSTLETAFLEALKESVDESSNAAIVIESMKQQPLLMLVSHEARQGKENFLMNVAGRVLGGRREKIEGDMCFVLEGKTVRCPTGDQIAGLMREGVMRGVSLFSYPFKYKKNSEGSHDVNNMLLVGADFTNEGGNLRHFQDKALAAPTLN